MLIYQLFVWLYELALRTAAALGVAKARLWVEGRSGLLQHMASSLPAGAPRIWMHCASLGEFEQGRPVLEAMRKKHPAYQIVLTFFSPSGYEIRKDYDGADYVFYLPMDGPRNAKAFLDAVNPSLVLFVKYEFWYFYLTELARRRIPTILISAAFRGEQAFFKWYGGFFRRILQCFTDILVQDKASAQLLAGIGIQSLIAGDTRYDRVLQIAAHARALPEIAAFKSGSRILIGGSTWPEDERILKEILSTLPAGWKMILAPHEIDAAHLTQIKALFGEEACLFSALQPAGTASARVLIIDNIGMLSSLYGYGDVAFIGGGFNKGGIHNVLEPAVFGLPVLTGPVYEKFVEAVALVREGLVFPVQDAPDAISRMNALLGDAMREGLRQRLIRFTRDHGGATDIIMHVVAQRLKSPARAQ